MILSKSGELDIYPQQQHNSRQISHKNIAVTETGQYFLSLLIICEMAGDVLMMLRHLIICELSIIWGLASWNKDIK